MAGLVVGGPARAQSEAADQALAEGRELYRSEGPRQALPEYERALDLFRQAGNRRGEAVTLGYIGNCHKRFGDYEKALELLGRALEAKRELGERLEEGKTLSHLGLVYWDLAEYARAIEHFESAIGIGHELEDGTLEASAINNLSLVYDELGDYQRSLKQYEQALDLYRELDFPQGESDTLGNIGGVHLLLGRYREAEGYYERALEISERLGSKISMSQDLGNLALCQLGLGEVGVAIQSFDRALALARQAGLHKEEADWLKGKAAAELQIGRYDQGLEMYRLALASYEAAGLKREWIEALEELGGLYVLLGDAPSAEHAYRRSLELSRRVGHPRGVTFALLALGDLERRRERLEQAVELFSQASARAEEAGDSVIEAAGQVQLALTLRDQGRFAEALEAADRALVMAQGIESPVQQAEALYARAEVHARKRELDRALTDYVDGDRALGAIGDPELGWRLAYGRGQVLEAMERNDEALEAYRRGAEIIESVRSRLREERFRAGYIEDKYEIYVALVRLLLKLERSEEAFGYAERLRARSYLDLLKRGPFNRSGGPTVKRAEELRARVLQLQRALEEESSLPRPQQRRQARQLFSEQLVTAEREYHNLLDDLHRAEPGRASAWSLAVPEVGEVQKALPDNAALLEYVIGEDTLSIFAVTSDALHAKRVAVSRVDLRAKVDLVRELILRKEGNEWREPAASLRALLIEPVEQAGWLDGKDRLLLIPHGILHYLPFSILPRDPASSGYLISDYAIGFLPSSAILVYPGERRSAKRTILALAPELGSLRFAAQEAKRVADLFAPEKLLLVGDKATETELKSRAGEFKVLHLATHGRLNKMNPLLSALELQPGSEGDDGHLEVHEVLDLEIAADLVTLSACETALGSSYFAEVPEGDDFVGLTRAFLHAGGESVLATLWEVDDRSTLDLMEGFYRRFNRKKDRAAALQGAQQAMSDEKSFHRHPYYWASFVLVGAMK